MTYEQATIARCTRNGRVQWQQVAIQLGVSVETARARHDRSYLRDCVPAPAAAVVQADEPRRSWRGQGKGDPNLDASLIRILATGPHPLATIVARSGHSRGTVISHLSKLRETGEVRHLREIRQWGPVPVHNPVASVNAPLIARERQVV